MAIKKSKAASAPEPVNSEQEAQQEIAAPGTQAALQPDVGELEERAAMAEEKAEASELRVSTLEQELENLKAQMKVLLQAQRAARAASPKASTALSQPAEGAEFPTFNEDEPYGLVVGDSEAAYVQNGHQFDTGKRYIATEVHIGSPRAFNPRLVGYTRPRPGQAPVDALEGIRGN